jgi:hypothetical protein
LAVHICACGENMSQSKHYYNVVTVVAVVIIIDITRIIILGIVCLRQILPATG